MGSLRLLLALSVVASHGTAILGSMLYPGDIAVQIFFMISGFYMALVIGDRYGLQKRGLVLFYTNRALRLFPAFLAVTGGGWALFFLSWIVLGRMPTNDWAADYATMSWSVKLPLIATNWLLVGTDVFSNFYYSATEGMQFLFPREPPLQIENGMVWMHSYRTTIAAWSIGTEIWFYLLVPFLVRLRWFWLVLLFALSLACRLWIVYSLGRYPYFFFPAQLLFFILGIWGFQLYRYWKPDAATIANSIWPRLLVCINLALVCFYPWYGKYVPQPILLLFVAVSIPWMFACTKDNRMDRLIGDISYPLYLVHLPVQSLLAHHAGIHNGTALAAVGILCAALVMILVERPLEKRRRLLVAQALPSTTT